MLDNFSWIVRGKIAGSSLPKDDVHFDFLKLEGIEVIINLTARATADKYKDRFELYHLEIPDFGTPDFKLVNKFWEIYKKAEANNKAVVVHCFAGCGRTGIILACWALLNGKKTTAEEAIAYIRTMRPCSIETKEQEEFINKYGTNYLKFSS